MEASELKNKRILIVGLGQTGLSLAHWLVRQKAKVTVSDHKSKAELSESLEKLNPIMKEVNLALGGHSPKVFLDQDLVILSPGVSPHLRIFDYISSHGVQVTGELEFAAQFVKEPMVAITGTNGKTTTAYLTAHMLKRSNKKVWLGGNYGSPLCNYLLHREKADVAVVEMSSFQLENVQKLAPQTVVFTNLSQGHQDRHRSMEDYIAAKRKIFLNTSANTTSILNADDDAVVELARDPKVQKGKIFYFSCKPALEPQIMNIGGCVKIGSQVRVRTGPEIEYFDVEHMRAKGSYMAENLMAATLAAREFGATHEAIDHVINNFSGLTHRLEYVRKVGGVEFYNDSKSTNPKAVERALESFGENVILIMGGKDSQMDYSLLQKQILQKVKTLFLVGEAKERINRDIGDCSETFLIGTFDEAVFTAFKKSRIGDTVLLSPGCSSYDLFASYIERGNYFKKLVRDF